MYASIVSFLSFLCPQQTGATCQTGLPYSDSTGTNEAPQTSISPREDQLFTVDNIIESVARPLKIDPPH